LAPNKATPRKTFHQWHTYYQRANHAAFVPRRRGEIVTPEEKVELAELLAYRTRSAFDIRRDRLRAAERRLGMWENGKFTGKGLADLLQRARRHDDASREGNDNGDRFSQDEFAVLNCGFRSHQEIEEANRR
jgi:hypothetical protein